MFIMISGGRNGKYDSSPPICKAYYILIAGMVQFRVMNPKSVTNILMDLLYLCILWCCL